MTSLARWSPGVIFIARFKCETGVRTEKIRPPADDPENYEKQKGAKSTSTDVTIFRNSQGLYTYISHLFVFQDFQDRQYADVFSPSLSASPTVSLEDAASFAFF